MTVYNFWTHSFQERFHRLSALRYSCEGYQVDESSDWRGHCDVSLRRIERRRIVPSIHRVSSGDSGTVGGLSYSVSTGGGGETIITLTGAGTLATYESAIEAIGFWSNSNNDSDRLIDVQVFDDIGVPSNVATSTISIDLDTDADGVINTIDIDDDNDGILDINETAANSLDIDSDDEECIALHGHRGHDDDYDEDDDLFKRMHKGKTFHWDKKPKAS